MFNKILNWLRYKLFLMRLKKIKRLLKWETETDKNFLEIFYSKELSYDDAADRNLLMAEREKEIKNQDQIKINELEEKIALAKAIKSSYRKTVNFLKEINLYLDFLNKRK